MSLYKAIESGKEHRIQCRNHGGCKWCEDNRTYRNRKNKAKSEVEYE